MTIRNRPNYGVYLIDLTNAGHMDIPCLATRISMTGAFLNATIGTLPGGQQGISGGTPSTANVNVQIGKTLGDALPFTVGCRVEVANKFEFVRLSWAAQANTTAVIVISDDADGNGVEMDAPPSVTLGTIAISEGGNTAAVTAAGALMVDLVANDVGTLPVTLKGGSGMATDVTNPALNALPQSSAGAQVQPGKLGASVFSSALGGGSNTILAPASNAHGVVIRTARMLGGGGLAALIAATSAPATAYDDFPIIATSGEDAFLPFEVLIPAGLGLYAFEASSGSNLFLTYDVV